jgi:predicted nucleic acid-binding protein
MLVVADSSPLVVLINIGHIDVLPALFGRVAIPPEVADELLRPRRPEAVRQFATSPPDWLDVRSPTIVEAIPALHAGEVAALALARELSADLLLIDESRGRKAAAARRMRVTGTIGVLELAAERGLLDLREAFDRVKQTEFWISHKLLDERLQLHVQRRGGHSG